MVSVFDVHTEFIKSEYLDRRGVNVVTGHPGLGKTKGAFEVALKRDNLILYVAPLKTLVQSQVDNLMREEYMAEHGRTVINYLDQTANWSAYLHPSSTQTNVILCISAYQLEHILMDGFRTDVTVILDEMCLIFNTLIMAPFMGPRISGVLTVLGAMLNECDTCFLLDAHFPEILMRWIESKVRSYNYIRVLNWYTERTPISSNSVYYNGNTWIKTVDLDGETIEYDMIAKTLSNRRTDVHLGLGKVKYRKRRPVFVTTDVAQWLRDLIAAVESGQRIFIPCSSATKAECLQKILKDKTGKNVFLAKAQLLHELKELDDTFRIVPELENPAYSVVIGTGCIWTGISLEGKGWDRVFALYDDKGGTVLDLYQALARCRVLLNSELSAKVCLLNETGEEIDNIDHVVADTKNNIVKQYCRIGNKYLPRVMLSGNYSSRGLMIDWGDIHTGLVLYFHLMQRGSKVVPYYMMEQLSDSYFIGIEKGNLKADNDISFVCKLGLVKRGLTEKNRMEFYKNMEYDPHPLVHRLNPLSRFMANSGLAQPDVWIEESKYLLGLVGPQQPLWSATFVYLYHRLLASGCNMSEVVDIYGCLAPVGEPQCVTYPNSDIPQSVGSIVTDTETYEIVNKFIGLSNTFFANRTREIFRLGHDIISKIPETINKEYLVKEGRYYLYEGGSSMYRRAYVYNGYLPEPYEIDKKNKFIMRWFSKVLLVFTNRYVKIRKGRRVPREKENIKQLALELQVCTVNRKFVSW